MKLSTTEIVDIIDNQTIVLKNCGIDNFPGYRILVDDDEIELNDGEIKHIKLYAWLERTGKAPEYINGYIISTYDHKYIIMDRFYEASSVWEYILDKYKVKL